MGKQQKFQLNLAEKTAAIRIGFFFSKELKINTDRLSTGWNKKKARKYLLKKWNIKEKDAIKNLLFYMESEGERTAFNIILPCFFAANGKEERRIKLEERHLSVTRLKEYLDNLSDSFPILNTIDKFHFNTKDLTNGILVWDIALIITITRIAYSAGYMNEEETWSYINNAYFNYKEAFKMPEQAAKSIILGEAIQKGNNPALLQSIENIQEMSDNDYFSLLTT